MNSSARRVAVLGGIRIPFARQNGPHARASNQDIMTATLEALIGKFSLQDETLAEVSAGGGVLKHSRDFNLARTASACWARAWILTPRPTTPAGLRHRARGRDPGGQQDRARADRLGDRRRVRHHLGAPIAVNEDLRQVLLEVNRARATPLG